MTPPIVTYADYSACGGRLSEVVFTSSLNAATRFVRYIIGTNQPEDAEQESAYVDAVCAAVDVDAAYGGSGGIGEGITSIAIGSVSMSATSGGTGSSDGYQIDMYRAVSMALSGTGLLYRGIG